MKYQFIHDHRSTFRVKKMCQVIGISRSGYYGWERQIVSIRKKENEKLVDHIKKVYVLSRKTYGSPRITAELKSQGIPCGENRVARIMRTNGIVARIKRRFKITTHSRHTQMIVPNLLKEKNIDTPNTAWVSDITYISTREGWLYLCVIIDIFSRQVIGWSMGERLTDNLAINALLQAAMRRNPIPSLTFHSDRGSQYASYRFRNILLHYGMIQSMSGKGNCYDNAYAESFFGTLKTELVYGNHYESRSIARQSIFEYIEVFYNRIRRHSALSYVSPMEFERKAMVA
jgi:transposase InsO family protein